MYDTAKDLIDALRAAPVVLDTLLTGVTQTQAMQARGGDENWSVVEVLCHLRDAEERAVERMRLMRDQSEPMLAAFDQEQWAHERNYAAADLREALKSFLQFRAAHLAELSLLPMESWDRTGYHSEMGRITLASHTLHIVSHDAIHLAQIARQLGAIHAT